MSNKENLQDILSSLPHEPGVYRFYDAKGELIYVGKAKSLKNRVNNYFHSSSDLNYKTKRLASQIRNIEFTVVNSEFDAFLLENALIKENKPRYNIQLKDDKSFPFICILDEPFPRIISTRRYKKYKGKYFGPYSNVKAMNTVLDYVRKICLIRTCKLNLKDENIKSGKFEVCLEYHIGNCLGPCVAHQSDEDYMNGVQQAENILKGKTHLVRSHYNELMKGYAEDLQFEKAEKIKKRIDLLKKYQDRTQIVTSYDDDMDIITITSNETRAFINYMQVSSGTIVSARNFELKKKLDETNEELLNQIVFQVREESKSKARLILSNVSTDFANESFEIVKPERGDKRQLVELSLKNAIQFKSDKTRTVKKPAHERILETLQADLHMKNMPRHIECFDNSNIQGQQPVASMVCFRNGKPSKDDYRHYNIKTVVGPDDFSSMNEIVTRRYKRLLEEDKPLPDLIVIDGGKGQLGAAKEALEELGIYGEIPIIGIAKRLEEIFTPDDKDPLFISKKSESLKLIQQIRNEAHRFAISFHRNQRSRAFNTGSSLNGIEGIGPKTEEALIKKFKSISKLKKASLDEIAEVVGNKKAEVIKKGLK